LLLLAGGCSIPVVNPGDLAAVRPASSAPRAGNVYLVRGWLGVFSTGIDTLGEKIKDVGLHDEVYQEAQWRDLAAAIVRKYQGVKNPEPLVLVGHSYGADDVIAIAREVEKANVTVDLLITLDATSPPPVPANVRHCYNLYQTNLLDALPVMRGVALRADPDFKGELDNVDIRATRKDLVDSDLNHFTIEKKDKIHQDAIKQILAVCPPRAQWAAGREQGRPSALLPPVVVSHARGPAVTALPSASRGAMSLSNNSR
jgi:hypothetical protein